MWIVSKAVLPVGKIFTWFGGRGRLIAVPLKSVNGQSTVIEPSLSPPMGLMPGAFLALLFSHVSLVCDIAHLPYRACQPSASGGFTSQLVVFSKKLWEPSLRGVGTNKLKS
jgi:hypothetical protein